MKRVLLFSLLLLTLTTAAEVTADTGVTNPPPPRPIGPPTPRPPEEDEATPQPIVQPTPPRPPIHPIYPPPRPPAPAPTPRPPAPAPTPRPPAPAPTPRPPAPAPAPTPTPLRYAYGAIAYSYSTERFGTSSRLRDSYSAERAAIANCAARDCNFVHWFVNGCMALSRSYNDGVYFALGRTAQEAQSNSYWNCQRSYGNCRLVTSACSF